MMACCVIMAAVWGMVIGINALVLGRPNRRSAQAWRIKDGDGK